MGVKGLKYPSLQSDNRADCVIFNQVWLTSRVLLRQSGWHSPSSLVSRINHGSMSCGHSASVTCLSLFLNKHELLIRIVRPRSAAFLWILWIFMQLRLSLSLSLSFCGSDNSTRPTRNRRRRRRLEEFTTDSKIIRLISRRRRVAVFSTAIATQQI